MAKGRTAREGHERHLCALAGAGVFEGASEAAKELVRSPRFVCRHCGRAASSAESLCEPEEI